MTTLIGLAVAAALTLNGAQAVVDGGAPAATPPAARAAVVVVGKVCVPLVEGESLTAVVADAGIRWRDGRWVMPIGGGRRVELFPPDAANPQVCTATLIHGVGAQAAIFRALDQWAKSQTPPLAPVKVNVHSVGSVRQRTVSTWEGQTPGGSIGLVLSEEKTLQGRPVDGTLDKTTLFVGLTPKGV